MLEYQRRVIPSSGEVVRRLKRDIVKNERTHDGINHTHAKLVEILRS